MRNLKSRRVMLATTLIGMLAVVCWLAPAVDAMPPAQFSPTPARVVLPTISPTLAYVMTPTPTRTPTPIGPALAEALEGPTNVRSGPDINAERLGQILPGEFYPILGRASGTLWYKIQYPDSPSGTAWVFEQVISITGDVGNIPELNLSSEPTIDVNSVVASQTLEVMALTPGALETATVQALFGGVIGNGETLTPSPTSGPLPTFTYPPGPVVQSTVVMPQAAQAAGDGGALPPIIPIIVLAAVGSFGLFIGILRRTG
jgi:hypothetical protein